MTTDVEIRTVGDALAWGDSWMADAKIWQKRAAISEFRLKFALATKKQRYEMMHSCPWPQGSERVFGEGVNWLWIGAGHSEITEL